MSTLHPILQQEIENIRLDFEKITAFANKLKVFENQIIGCRVNGESYCTFTHYHKNVYFPWGINWQTNIPINFESDRGHTNFEPSVSVYINCLSMFGEKAYTYARKSLTELENKISCYYYDSLNTTFYFSPEEAEEKLDLIVEWCTNVQKEVTAILAEARRAELLKELEKLEALQ